MTGQVLTPTPEKGEGEELTNPAVLKGGFQCPEKQGSRQCLRLPAGWRKHQKSLSRESVL